MSWDASLIVQVDGHDLEVGDWNYTHNCNRMVSAVLEEAGQELGDPHWLIGHMGKSWFYKLDGQPAPDGERLLTEAIDRLAAEPERFKAMNPSNGWGDYDSLLEILREMRQRASEYPSAKFEVSG